MRMTKVGLVGACVLLLCLTGCGTNATLTSPITSTHKSLKALKPVPAALTAYGIAVGPSVVRALQEARALLAKMQREPLSSLTVDCSNDAQDLSSYANLFHAAPAPGEAQRYTDLGAAGFKLILGATDECGIAADSGSSSAMKTAEGDLSSGIWDLSRASSAISSWSIARP